MDAERRPRVAPDADIKIGTEVYPTRSTVIGSTNGNGRVNVGRDHCVDEAGADEIRDNGKQEQDACPEDGIAPVSRLNHPVPLFPLRLMTIRSLLTSTSTIVFHVLANPEV